MPRLVPCEGTAILRNLIAQLGPGGEKDEGEDHRDVLDDQPADGDAPALRLDDMPFLKRTQQHHGGGDGEGEAEDDAAFERPAQQVSHADAEQCRGQDLRQRARDGDGADGEQVVQGEVQADAEHQQDDADLGEFRGELCIAHEAGGERADDHARDQVSNQRRQLQTGRDHAEDKGQAQANGQKRDQRCPVGHRAVVSLDWGEAYVRVRVRLADCDPKGQ